MKKDKSLDKPLLVVMMGPSGVGKDAVYDVLRKSDLDIEFCKRDTTRNPRPSDPQDLNNYRFVAPDEFMVNLDNGKYVMPNKYAENWYGVPIEEIGRINQKGSIPVLKGTLNVLPGAIETFSHHFEFLNIYIYPPSLCTLESRLRKRSTESREAIMQRIGEAFREIEAAHNGLGQYIDLHVVNQDGGIHQTAEEISLAIHKKLKLPITSNV